MLLHGCAARCWHACLSRASGSVAGQGDLPLELEDQSAKSAFSTLKTYLKIFPRRALWCAF